MKKTQKLNKKNTVRRRQLFMNIKDGRGRNIFSHKRAYSSEYRSDIAYHGPLSYRGLKIIALLFLFLGFSSGTIPLFVDLAGGDGKSVEWIVDVLLFLQQISLPLIIMSAFCIILQDVRVLKPIMIIHGLCALGVYIGTLFLLFHYAIPVGQMLNPESSYAEVYASVNAFLIKDFSNLINYNVFLDLFICTLFFFFTNYTPKKLNGKKLKLFRACAIFPLIYLISSIIVFGLFQSGVITVNVPVLAALVCRSPVVYIVFFALSVYLYIHRERFLKYGGDQQDYEKYKRSNRSSFQFSAFCSIVLAVVSLVDFLLSFIPGAVAWGFGKSYFLCLAIPFMMLTSYTRTYQNKSADIIFPVVFVFMTIFVVIELVFQLFLSYK